MKIHGNILENSPVCSRFVDGNVTWKLKKIVPKPGFKVCPVNSTIKITLISDWIRSTCLEKSLRCVALVIFFFNFALIIPDQIGWLFLSGKCGVISLIRILFSVLCKVLLTSLEKELKWPSFSTCFYWL